MEAATSVVGLLAVGGKIFATLHQFLADFSDPPLTAQSTCENVRKFRFVLAKLQPYVDGSTPLTSSGASMTDVNQLSLTLATCVDTFSQLEKHLDHLLKQGHTGALGRMKWNRASNSLCQFVKRLEKHIETLTLLLTMWTSDESTKEEPSWTQLNKLLVEILKTPQRAQTSAITPWETIREEQTANETQRTQSDDDSSIVTITSARKQSYRRSFESTLSASRPYRGVRRSASLASSQARGTRWSLFSGGSNMSVLSLSNDDFKLSGKTVAGAADLSKINLPIRVNDLYDPSWYFPDLVVSRQFPTPSHKILFLASRAVKGKTSILFDAVKRRDKSTVNQMLKHGADIESTENKQRTVLHAAAQTKDRGMVELLLDKGANINATDEDKQTPLVLAIILGYAPMVSLLLEREATINFCESLQFAVFYAHEPIVQVLLARAAQLGIHPNEYQPPLNVAAQWGYERIVKLLLDRGASLKGPWPPNSETPLHLSAENGHGIIVQLLLDRGVAIDAQRDDSFTALYLASQSGHETVVRMLLDGGAEVNAQTSSPLHAAAKQGHKGVVQLLLSRGADKQSKDCRGKTPLELAISRGHKGVVDLLSSEGPGVDTVNSSAKNTPTVGCSFHRVRDNL